MLNKYAKEIAKVLAYSLLIAYLVPKFLFFVSHVPTGSMYPTIKPNDDIIVSRVYRKSNLKRGDIVVFKNDELNKTMVKRLIGLPGDVIRIKEGKVSINGEYLDDLNINEYGDNASGTFIIPDDNYFFLGDNRTNSHDSRFWNNPYIPASNIVGKAVFRYNDFSDFNVLK